MIFCGGLKRAGLEKVVYDLAIGMKKRGFDVQVSCVITGELEEGLRAAGISVTVLSGTTADNYQSNPAKSLLMALKLGLLLRRRAIQALNIHGIGAERIGLFAAKLAGVAVKTFVFHNSYPPLYPEAVRSRLSRNLAGVQGCIAVTEEVKKFIVGASIVEEKKMFVITNGIDLQTSRPSRSRKEVRKELGLGEDDFVIIQVGRFVPAKNHDVSVMAMRKVISRYPHAHLLLAGHGSVFNQTKELVEKLDLIGHIHFLGIRSDVLNLLGASDLFLLPSSSEGLSISLLEAFACSLPTVGSDVVGIRHIIDRNPSCAKLVKERDEGALAEAILEAIDDPLWRNKARRSALYMAHHYSLDKTIERYIELHENLFEKKAAVVG